MRVVVDTNVFIKALYHGDKWCGRILEEEKLGSITFVMSESTQRELCKTIIYIGVSKGLTLAEFRKPFELITNCLSRVHFVDPRKKFDVSEHKADNKFIDCAVESKSEYIIAEDNHLNSIGTFNVPGKKQEKIKILSPYQFMMDYNIVKLQNKWSR